MQIHIHNTQVYIIHTVITWLNAKVFITLVKIDKVTSQI